VLYKSKTDNEISSFLIKLLSESCCVSNDNFLTESKKLLIA